MQDGGFVSRRALVRSSSSSKGVQLVQASVFWRLLAWSSSFSL